MIRSHESMRENFITKPSDVWTILFVGGGLSNCIAVKVTNEVSDEEFILSLTNDIDSWKALKDINETGGRSVVVATGVRTETVPYEDSAPYKHRFSEEKE